MHCSLSPLFCTQVCYTMLAMAMKTMGTVSWFLLMPRIPTAQQTACVCRTSCAWCRRSRRDSTCSCWICVAKGTSCTPGWWQLTSALWDLNRKLGLLLMRSLSAENSLYGKVHGADFGIWAVRIHSRLVGVKKITGSELCSSLYFGFAAIIRFSNYYFTFLCFHLLQKWIWWHNSYLGCSEGYGQHCFWICNVRKFFSSSVSQKWLRLYSCSFSELCCGPITLITFQVQKLLNRSSQELYWSCL